MPGHMSICTDGKYELDLAVADQREAARRMAILVLDPSRVRQAQAQGQEQGQRLGVGMCAHEVRNYDVSTTL